MSLLLLLGGGRSGKSALAVRLAAASASPVTFIATGEPRDEEMADRIRQHRAERPLTWATIEEPVDLVGALAGTSDDSAVIVECLSLWVANVLERGDTDAQVEREARSAAELARARTTLTVVVSNEVGLGLVPATPLGRRYRDVLGRVNAAWASSADETALVVAGRVLRLESAERLLR
jgi:adenosylcobinamide kinase / adenosylcobinamide-phosphate guanylyltransferase